MISLLQIHGGPLERTMQAKNNNNNIKHSNVIAQNIIFKVRLDILSILSIIAIVTVITAV